MTVRICSANAKKVQLEERREYKTTNMLVKSSKDMRFIKNPRVEKRIISTIAKFSN